MTARRDSRRIGYRLPYQQLNNVNKITVQELIVYRFRPFMSTKPRVRKPLWTRLMRLHEKNVQLYCISCKDLPYEQIYMLTKIAISGGFNDRQFQVTTKSLTFSILVSSSISRGNLGYRSRVRVASVTSWSGKVAALARDSQCWRHNIACQSYDCYPWFNNVYHLTT